MQPRITLSRASALAVALLVSIAPACSGGNDNSARTAKQSPSRPDRPATTTAGPTTPPPTTPTPTTPTPTTLPPTATAPPGPAMYFPSHEAASDHLFMAWQDGDRAEAVKGATTEAVDALFSVPSAGWQRYYYGGYCDTGEFDQGTCNYRSDTQYARVLSTHTPPGWQVTSVKISEGL